MSHFILFNDLQNLVRQRIPKLLGPDVNFNWLPPCFQEQLISSSQHLVEFNQQVECTYDLVDCLWPLTFEGQWDRLGNYRKLSERI